MHVVACYAGTSVAVAASWKRNCLAAKSLGWVLKYENGFMVHAFLLLLFRAGHG